MLKPFQTYIYELEKLYEFRIKVAGSEPTKEVMEAIKNALETYELESITTVKHLPIQEHREFPQLGNSCECWQFDVAVKYPTTTAYIAQVIKERARINSAMFNVRNLHEADYTDEAEALNKDAHGALLDEQELKDQPDAQALVGPGRVASLIAELEKHTRKHEIAGNDVTTEGAKDPAYGKTTNDKKVPPGNKSAMGTTQNKVYAQGKIGLNK